jgi:hypothetical protein
MIRPSLAGKIGVRLLQMGCCQHRSLLPPPPVVHKECTERVDETPGGSVFDCEHGDGRPTTELVDYDQEVPAFHLAELVRGVAEVPPVKKEVVLRILRMRLRRGQYRSLCGAIER